jgi:hypothetical protein
VAPALHLVFVEDTLPHLTHNQRIREAAEKRSLFDRVDGFQIRRIRRPRKNVPPWANDMKSLRKRVLGRAMVRLKIAYLYWRIGLNAREVAAELGITRRAVTETLARLKRETA